MGVGGGRFSELVDWLIIQYNITLLPSVNTTALGMFRGVTEVHSSHIHTSHEASFD